MKRVLSIQDISCVGKCSLTVSLPILSAAGAECAILPTAVLSAHTAVEGFTFRDLSGDIPGIVKHWQERGFTFDGITTGYLGDFSQIDMAKEIFAYWKKDAPFILVDPVIGDFGKYYPGFTPDFARGMGTLCGKADLIVPNLTEASFLLQEEYIGDRAYTEKEIRELLKKLGRFGSPVTALTGISFEEGRCGVAVYDHNKDHYFTVFGHRYPGIYHGTGDVFSSSLFGAILHGQDLENAFRTAVDLTAETIRLTMLHEDRRFYGVDFESAIPFYLQLLGLAKVTPEKE